MAAVSREAVRAPFSYFGGKGKVAPVVWRAFGADVSSYVEPFAGSLAVLLARPGGAGKLETVNDRALMVANVWRAIQQDPYEVAAYCDWPVSEVDQNARHRWLVAHLQQTAEFREKMLGDPAFHDPKIAGWWLYGAATWIGSGWCREPGQGTEHGEPRPHLGNPTGVHQKIPDLYGRGAGRGVRSALPERDSVEAYAPSVDWDVRPGLHGNKGIHVAEKRPIIPDRGCNSRGLNLGNTRRGIGRDRIPAGHAEIVNALAAELEAGRAPPCFGWFLALADRLRRVRIVCGDWSRVLTPSVLGTTRTRNSGMVPCAVFLDPPYNDELRDPNIYSVDDGAISTKVREWALEHGDDPDLRIALCGYSGEHEIPPGWTVHAWKGVKGYGSGKNRDKERIWFSPHCLPLEGAVRQGSLF